MHSIESIAAEIVRREGGYVNDPDDPGGATKHGVTLATMQRLKLDLTGDGRVDVADLHRLDPAKAAEIYVRRYYAEPRLDLARMLADNNVPRAELLRLAGGCTPARLVEIISHLNVLEMMVGLAKMRVRRTPANQAHVTNRREHPALQRTTNLSFHTSENDNILFYRRAAPSARDRDLLVAVNLDPHHVQETMVHVPLDALGIGAHETFTAHDLLSDERYQWSGVRNYVRLDPAARVAHVLCIER